MQQQELKWRLEKEQEKRWQNWELSEQQRSTYKRMFINEDTDNDGFITGEQARVSFENTGLKLEVLGKIWSLSDRNKDKKLDLQEYMIAMFLIEVKCLGESLPMELPEKFLKSVYLQSHQSRERPVSVGISRSFPTEYNQKSASLTHVMSSQIVRSASSYRSDDVELDFLNGEINRIQEQLKQLQHKQIQRSNSNVDMQDIDKESEASYQIQSPQVFLQQEQQQQEQEQEQQQQRILQSPSQQRILQSPSQQQQQQQQQQRILQSSSPSQQQQRALKSSSSSSQQQLERQDSSPINQVEIKQCLGAPSPYGEMPPLDSSSLPVYLSDSNEKLVQSKSSSPYGVPIIADTSKEYGQSSSSGSIAALKAISTLSSSSSSVSLLSSSSSNGIPWEEYVTSRNKKYYYNVETGLVTWDPPAKFVHGTSVKVPSPPPDPENETVRGLLTDPSKVEFFKKFLESEKTNNEMLFYMDVESLMKEKDTSGHHLKEIDLLKMQAIYAKYIIKGAPFPVALSLKTLKELRKVFKRHEKGDTGSLKRDIFCAAQQEIFKVMELSQFPLFMKSMFYISMYNSMMSRAPYELPDILWKEFKIAAQGGPQEGWEYVLENKGVLVYRKEYKGTPGISIRGSSVVPLSPEEMKIFAVSIDLRKEWDYLYGGARVVEFIDEKTAIVHLEFRRPKWAIGYDPHDFVMIRTERTEEDGTIMVLSRSVVHKDVPPRKGYVRSELEVSGFFIKPCGESSSVVVYVNQAELHGIPKWAENRFLNKRALLIGKIRKFIEKEFKEMREKKKLPAWRAKNLL